jgi:hypothetical protein
MLLARKVGGGVVSRLRATRRLLMRHRLGVHTRVGPTRRIPAARHPGLVLLIRPILTIWPIRTGLPIRTGPAISRTAIMTFGAGLPLAECRRGRTPVGRRRARPLRRAVPAGLADRD